MRQKSHHFVALRMVVVETQWKMNFGYHMTVRPVYKLNVCAPQLATLYVYGKDWAHKKGPYTHRWAKHTYGMMHTHPLLFLCKCKNLQTAFDAYIS